MCIDYRGLNAMTERDVYPLPRVADVFAAIKGKKVLRTLDLLKGYWQIGIQPCDRHFRINKCPIDISKIHDENFWRYDSGEESGCIPG